MVNVMEKNLERAVVVKDVVDPIVVTSLVDVQVNHIVPNHIVVAEAEVKGIQRKTLTDFNLIININVSFFVADIFS